MPYHLGAPLIQHEIMLWQILVLVLWVLCLSF